jgi:peptide/nickel transport system substrate-binding protein
MPRARRLAAVAAAVLFAAATPPSFGQTLRIAMTASDTPTTTGIPNNGGEGFRFCGFPAFDGLIDWDFTHPERIAGLTPASPANGRSMTATTPAGSSPFAAVSNFTMAPM